MIIILLILLLYLILLCSAYLGFLIRLILENASGSLAPLTFGGHFLSVFRSSSSLESKIAKEKER